jgi:hypothetical protein
MICSGGVEASLTSRNAVSIDHCVAGGRIRLEVPANVVASWSQSGRSIGVGNPVTEPLS